MSSVPYHAPPCICLYYKSRRRRKQYLSDSSFHSGLLSAVRRCAPYLRFFYYFLFSHISHAEAESSHLVLAKAYDLDHVADRKDILNLVHSLLGDLGDMDQAFLARCELEKCAEVFDRKSTRLNSSHVSN